MGFFRKLILLLAFLLFAAPKAECSDNFAPSKAKSSNNSSAEQPKDQQSVNVRILLCTPVTDKETKPVITVPMSFNPNTTTVADLYNKMKTILPNPRNRERCVIPDYEMEFVLLAHNRPGGDRDKILTDGSSLASQGVIAGSVIEAGPPRSRAAAAVPAGMSMPGYKNSDRKGAWKQLNPLENIPQHLVTDRGLNLLCECSKHGEVYHRLGVVQEIDVGKYADPDQNPNFKCPVPGCDSHKPLKCKELVFHSPWGKICKINVRGRLKSASEEDPENELRIIEGQCEQGKVDFADSETVGAVSRWHSLKVTTVMEPAAGTVVAGAAGGGAAAAPRDGGKK
jgi:hypothetical protein